MNFFDVSCYQTADNPVSQSRSDLAFHWKEQQSPLGFQEVDGHPPALPGLSPFLLPASASLFCLLPFHSSKACSKNTAYSCNTGTIKAFETCFGVSFDGWTAMLQTAKE